MKIRCTVCGALNQSAPGFDTAYCLTCGSPFHVADGMDYKIGPDAREILGEDGFLALVKEAYLARKTTPEVLKLLHAAAPTGDVEINYYLGNYYFGEREFAEALPYLRISAEKMYPDGQCLFGVALYLQDPENRDNYPIIKKALTTAKETCSKIFDKIGGDKLLQYVSTALDAKPKAQHAPTFTNISSQF